jgi:hypothetical protein
MVPRHAASAGWRSRLGPTTYCCDRKISRSDFSLDKADANQIAAQSSASIAVDVRKADFT